MWTFSMKDLLQRYFQATKFHNCMQPLLCYCQGCSRIKWFFYVSNGLPLGDGIYNAVNVNTLPELISWAGFGVLLLQLQMIEQNGWSKANWSICFFGRWLRSLEEYLKIWNGTWCVAILFLTSTTMNTIHNSIGPCGHHPIQKPSVIQAPTVVVIADDRITTFSSQIRWAGSS